MYHGFYNWPPEGGWLYDMKVSSVNAFLRRFLLLIKRISLLSILLIKRTTDFDND